MRTIKFRAWHKISEGEYKMIVGSRSNRYNLTFDGDLMIYDSISGDYINPVGKLIVMQYTGLKDRSGQDIYEGDIVLHSQTGEKREVLWEEDSVQPFGFFYYENPEDWKIIGNIYEHPELTNTLN